MQITGKQIKEVGVTMFVLSSQAQFRSADSAMPHFAQLVIVFNNEILLYILLYFSWIRNNKALNFNDNEFMG